MIKACVTNLPSNAYPDFLEVCFHNRHLISFQLPAACIRPLTYVTDEMNLQNKRNITMKQGGFLLGNILNTYQN